MENITLYDEETESLVEVLLSKEDANRVRNDSAYAKLLLNNALQQNKLHDETPANVLTDESSSYRWSTSAVMLLLDRYHALENDLSTGKVSHKKLWEKICSILREHNHNVTGPQCASKFRSLKKTYKSIKDHNSKSGNDRRSWQFYEKMDEMFSKKAWCNPVAVASSTGMATENNSVVGDYADSDCVDVDDPVSEASTSEHSSSTISTYKSSKSKTLMHELMRKRLRQKEEYEQNKMKRHKDRMEMDNKFLEVLNKLVDK